MALKGTPAAAQAARKRATSAGSGIASGTTPPVRALAPAPRPAKDGEDRVELVPEGNLDEGGEPGRQGLEGGVGVRLVRRLQLDRVHERAPGVRAG